MTITPDQLRTALGDLNGQRTVRIEFVHAETCIVKNALLVPAEEDNLLKLTDGSREFVVDSGHIAWMEIG